MAKREAELLAGRIDMAVDEIGTTVRWLTDNLPDLNHVQVEAGVMALNDLLRLIQFDALRIERLAEADSDTLRATYSLTVETIDRLRAKGVLGDPAETIAVMQKSIEDLFPGEDLEM